MSSYTKTKNDILQELNINLRKATNELTIKQAKSTALYGAQQNAMRNYAKAKAGYDTAGANVSLAKTTLLSIGASADKLAIMQSTVDNKSTPAPTAVSANDVGVKNAQDLLDSAKALLDKTNQMVLDTLTFAKSAVALSSSINSEKAANKLVSDLIVEDATAISTDAGTAVTNAINAFSATLNLVNAAALVCEPLKDAGILLKTSSDEICDLYQRLEHICDEAGKTADKALEDQNKAIAAYQAALAETQLATKKYNDANNALHAAGSALNGN